MDTILITLFGVLGIALVLLAVTGLIFVNNFNPEIRKKRLISKQAKIDYKNARGTAHLNMLVQAREKLNGKINQLGHQISALKTQIDQLKIDRDRALLEALETHIVSTHFDEVPGISQTMKDRIVAALFKGHLTDLHNARYLTGVGPARQAAISQWINKYLGQIDILIKNDFPQKKKILEAFEEKLKTHQLAIPKLEEERKRVSQLLANADQEIQRLQRIQPKHFAIALANPAEFSDDVENYLRGSFAEWEPIPQWFVDIVEFENRNV